MRKLVDVIKYENNEGKLIYKHPKTDFNVGSQLIVHETQQAVFFKDGKALQTFGPGSYTLNSKNIPILRNLFETITGGESFFHVEIYFIDLTTKIGIKWGTDSKIGFLDPISGLHLEIGACGTFNIKVSDGRKFLLKVVGTNNEFEVNQIISESFGINGQSFRGMVIQKVKCTLARLIKKNSINILEIDEKLDFLSNELMIEINKDFEEYGMLISNFNITSINYPDDDPNFKRLKEQYAEKYLLVQEQRIKKDEALMAKEVAIVKTETEQQTQIIKAETQAQIEVILAKAHGEALQAQGANYYAETARMIGIKAAENESGNGTSIASEIIKAGVGVGVGTTIAKTVLDSIENGKQWECKKCGWKENKGLFCEHCGTRKNENEK